MKIMKIIVSIICCLLGLYLVLYEVVISLSEPYLLRDAKLNMFLLLIVLTGIALVTLGIRIALSTRRQRH